jgi:hypothetical protein
LFSRFNRASQTLRSRVRFRIVWPFFVNTDRGALMAFNGKITFGRLFSSEQRENAEVERIASLQQAAAARRSEYAAEQERQILLTASDSSASFKQSAENILAACRKRMSEAETAYALAKIAWDNKQWRYKTR